MNSARFLAANGPSPLLAIAAKSSPQMLRRCALLGHPTKHRVFSSLAAVPFSRTQQLVPTLPVPPLPQTISKYTHLTSAILPDSQAHVRKHLSASVLLSALTHPCLLAQDAAAAAQRFMKVFPPFSFASRNSCPGPQGAAPSLHEDLVRYAGAALAASSVPRRIECCLQSRDHFRVKLAFAIHSLLNCSKRPGLVIHRREMGSNRVFVLQVIDCGALCCLSRTLQPQHQGSRGAFLQSFLHRSRWRRQACCLCRAIKEEYGLTLRRFEEQRWRRTGSARTRPLCPLFCSLQRHVFTTNPLLLPFIPDILLQSSAARCRSPFRALCGRRNAPT
jgi:DNA-binding transcriptional ArsR family regulator